MIEIRHAKWECKKVIENQSLWDHLCMYVKDEHSAVWNLRVYFFSSAIHEKMGRKGDVCTVRAILDETRSNLGCSSLLYPKVHGHYIFINPFLSYLHLKTISI